MNLTDEKKQDCINGGKFGLNAKKLAALLLLPVDEVRKALDDPENEICKYYSKGKVEFMIEPLKALELEASKGNVKAARALFELKNKLEVDQMIDEHLGR